MKAKQAKPKWFKVVMSIIGILAVIIIVVAIATGGAKKPIAVDMPNFSQDANTSDRVDEIAKAASEFSKNAEEGEIKFCIEYIEKNIDDPFSNNKSMEAMMYYAEIIDHYGAANENEEMESVGFNAFAAVKYVYRGAEKIADSSTKLSIEKCKKRLAKLDF